MRHASRAAAPVIVFGAFDRHNFGDLLFAHVNAALLPGHALRFAGLVERDLRPCGGHHVEALADVLARLQGQAFNLVHAGGELLTCTDVQAAFMLLDDAQVREILAGRAPYPPPVAPALHDDRLPARIPYVAAIAGDNDGQRAARIVFNAVGGVELDRLDTPMRTEVLEKLRVASWIGVRERITFEALRCAGLAPQLLPDPAVLVTDLFAPRIALHQREGEPALVAQRFPRGYFAVQCSTDFADDATLTALAHQLDEFAARQSAGLVLFRAGAAPWHDTLDVYQALAARLRTPVHVFHSLKLWDICALIAASRAYCGSSLHGRIVAMAYALPRVNIAPADSRENSKQAAYASTWDPGLPGCVRVSEVAAALEAALAIKPARLQACARELVATYRARVGGMLAALV